MNNNIERAAEITYDTLNGKYDDFSHHKEVARALAGATPPLLMPDLPEPDLAHDDSQWIADHRETWEADYGDDYETPDVWGDAGPETSIAVFPETGGGMVHPTYDGETTESVTASEARRIGMKWLAAANHAERNQK